MAHLPARACSALLTQVHEANTECRNKLYPAPSCLPLAHLGSSRSSSEMSGRGFHFLFLPHSPSAFSDTSTPVEHRAAGTLGPGQRTWVRDDSWAAVGPCDTELGGPGSTADATTSQAPHRSDQRAAAAACLQQGRPPGRQLLQRWARPCPGPCPACCLSSAVAGMLYKKTCSY